MGREATHCTPLLWGWVWVTSFLPTTPLNTHTHTHTELYFTQEIVTQPFLSVASEYSQVYSKYLAVVGEALRSTQAHYHHCPRWYSSGGRGGIFFYELPAIIYHKAEKKWVGMVARVPNLRKGLMQTAPPEGYLPLFLLLSPRVLRSPPPLLVVA